MKDVSTDNGRDERGQFAPGCAPGPGRPARQTERDYLRATAAAVPLDTWAKIVAKAAEDAEAGDDKARSWLSRYLLPAPSTADREPLLDLAAQDEAGVDPVEDAADRERRFARIFDLIDRAGGGYE